MFRPARLPFSPISPLSRRLFVFIRKWHRRNSYLRHGAGSLHRRLYSGQIILVTKSIVTAAIKILHGSTLQNDLHVVSEAVHSGKVVLHFSSGKDCQPGSQDKGRHRIAPLFHRELCPTSSTPRKRKKKSCNQKGYFSQERMDLMYLRSLVLEDCPSPRLLAFN